MSSFDFDSLFDGEQSNLDAFRRRGNSDSVIYKPKTDSGKEGVYKSVIRFIPWYKNKQKSIVQKWAAWLVDPMTNQGKTVDCPSSVGKPSDLFKMWKKLRDSEDVEKQAQAERFSRRMNCYSLVQILKDDNAPELVGKIMVFKYGKKFKDMIESEINPEIGSPRDPFNLLTGRRFIIHLKKSGKWDDVTSSRFDGEPYPFLQIDGKKVDVSEAMKSPEQKKMIAEWLENNSPNLEDFEFKDWNEETTDFVNNIIRFVETGGASAGSIIEDVYNEASSSKPKRSTVPNQKVTSIADILDDDIAPAKTSSKASSQKAQDSSDNIDLIDDLDLSQFEDDLD